MSAGSRSIPRITEDRRKAIRELATDANTRPQVEALLTQVQQTLTMAERQLVATTEAIAKLEEQKRKWQEDHDNCLHREQLIQAVLDETQGGLRV